MRLTDFGTWDSYRRVALLATCMVGLCTLPVLADHDPLDDTASTPNQGYVVNWTDDNPYNPDTNGDGSCDVNQADAGDVPAGADANYFPTAQANSILDAYDNNDAFAVGNPNGHHAGFTALGFTPDDWREPTDIYDCTPHGGCDTGQANSSLVRLPAPAWICTSDAALRLVVGHELFHHVQYEAGFGGSWSDALMEGTARMMQDQVYSDLDGDGGSDGCCLYNGQVGEYMSNPDRDLFSDSMSYSAALWWKYATEQFGAFAAEPNLGTDFIVRLFANRKDGNSDLEDLIERTIQETDPSTSLDEAFLDFVIANIAREFDVSGLADAIKYLYLDEKDGVSGAYADVVRTLDTSMLPNRSGSGSVTRWGADYLEVALQDCPTGIAGFRSQGDRAAYGFLTVRQDGSVDRVFKGVTTDFAKAIILGKRGDRNPIDRLVAVVAGPGSDADYSYDFACGSASIEILRPEVPYVAYVGNADEPERFTVRLRVTGPSQLGVPTVQGLDPSNFAVYVGGTTAADEATILSGAEVQGEYWITAQAPVKPANGDYNLRVELVGAASDTEALAIRYEERILDEVIVVDRSGSMLSPAGFPKIEAAKNAASILADAAYSKSQIGAVSFGGDNSETNDDATLERMMDTATDTQREAVKTAIQGISIPNASVLTSIGDGLEKARQEFLVRGTALGEDVITLLSDGMENEAAYVSSLLPALQAQGVAVHAIALGPLSDQALLQNLATQTGGTYYYVDVGTAASAPASAPAGAMLSLASAASTASLPLQLRLSDAYLSAYEAANDAQRIEEHTGTTGSTYQKSFKIEESNIVDGRITVAWDIPGATVNVKVFENGNPLVDGVGGVEIYQGKAHVEIHVPSIPQGEVLVEIDPDTTINFLMAISGRPIVGADLKIAFDQVADPFVIGEGGVFQYGKPVRLVAFLGQSDGGIADATVEASILHPEGYTDLIPLYDDGAHDDGQPNDGVYGNIYRRTTKSSISRGSDQVPTPDKGSYNVEVIATGEAIPVKGDKPVPFKRIRKGAFQVLTTREQKDLDTDKDGMPNAYEDSLDCLNALVPDESLDVDNDTLRAIDEWKLGTNPCAQDTDFGGIHDGSELAQGLNPFDPRDDYLRTPRMVNFLERFPEHRPDDYKVAPGAIGLRYPTHPDYDRIRVYRSTNQKGPFTVIDEFKPDGSSLYYDTTVNLNQQYFYHFQALGTSNAETAWSPVVAGVAKNDPFPPLGGIDVVGGPVVNSVNVTLNLHVDGGSFDTKEYRLKNLGDSAFGPWQPMAQLVPWTLSPDAHGTATVFVEYRDAEDNRSLVYHAKAKVLSAAGLGTVAGKVSVIGSGAPPTLAGVIRVSLPGVDMAPVYVDENGEFRLMNVPPGSQTVWIILGVEHQVEVPIQVFAGAITEVAPQQFVVEAPAQNQVVPLLPPLAAVIFGLILSLVAIRLQRNR